MHVIEGRTADEVWREAARRILAREGTIQEPSRDGETLELLHSCLVVREPLERWVLNRRPALNPAFALAEIVWILSGRDDAGFLNFWNPKLPEFAGRGPLYYGAYGQRLRYRFGIDQLRYATEALCGQPNSRQVVLQIWDAASDLPIEAGRPRSTDVPCNVCSLLKVRNGRLEWVQVMRSNDLKLGWPHNVVQFSTLQEMMAGWIGVEIGTYTHFSDSLHVYERDLGELVEPDELKIEANRDRWTMAREETLEVIEDIGHRMDVIRASGRNAEAIRREGIHEYQSSAATNALSIIAADAARRANDQPLARELAARCTNPALTQAWLRWRKRQDGREVDSNADQT